MTTTAHAAAPRATAGFADIVCADEQWLRAEFEAIVAANWDEEAPASPLQGPDGDQPPGNGDLRPKP